jgi:20S proteasome alpha/beta subunit
MKWVREFLESYSPIFESPDFGPIPSAGIPLSLDQRTMILQQTLEEMKSSTTIFALKYDGGKKVLVAGDRLTTAGYNISDTTTVKVMPIYKHSAVAFTGHCSSIKKITDLFMRKCAAYKDLYATQISPEGQANMLSDIMQAFQEYAHVFGRWYWIAVPILVTFDRIEERARVFEFENNGYHREVDTVGEGCGWEVIRGQVSRDLRKKGIHINEKTVIDIAVDAMYESGELNTGVGNTRLYPPTIFLLGMGGLKQIDEHKIKNMIDQRQLDYGDIELNVKEKESPGENTDEGK